MIPIYFYPMSWIMFDIAIDKLTEIIDTKNKKYIYGIPRGGMPLAVALSHKLNLEMTQIPIDHPHALMNGNNTIIVDDICDSGKTIGWLIEQDWDCYTWLLRENCKVKPKGYVNYMEENTWVVFPWEDKTKANQDYKNYMRKNNETKN